MGRLPKPSKSGPSFSVTQDRRSVIGNVSVPIGIDSPRRRRRRNQRVVRHVAWDSNPVLVPVGLYPASHLNRQPWAGGNTARTCTAYKAMLRSADEKSIGPCRAICRNAVALTGASKASRSAPWSVRIERRQSDYFCEACVSLGRYLSGSFLKSSMQSLQQNFTVVPS